MCIFGELKLKILPNKFLYLCSNWRPGYFNWMNIHLKHCSRLNTKGFDTILIGDSLMVGLNHYSKVWYNFFKPLIWERRRGTGGDICIMVSAWFIPLFRNVIVLCSSDNLYQDSPEDIANGLIKIASGFKQDKMLSMFSFVAFFLVMVYLR